MNDFNERMTRGRRKKRIIIVECILIFLLFITFLSFFRFDFAEGSHKIIPTAVDTDFFGNYCVYYKTSVMTQNIEESFYYVTKDNPEIAEQIKDAILKDQTIVVYYGKLFGFYSFTTPREAPIYRVESIE